MVKMSEVAARAGVSQATVSFVLGGRADQFKISPQTCRRVLRVAREMGYERNQLARAMITGKSRILGILTSPDFGVNILETLTGAVEAASGHDYLVKVLHLSDDAVDEATIVRCLEWRLAGVMAFGLGDACLMRLSEVFQAKGLAMATIDTASAGDWGICIRSDDGQGIRQVVTHLHALGHRRIAFLGGPACLLSDLRVACFRAALSEAGLSVPEQWVQATDWRDPDIIESDVHALFQAFGGDFPSAIVCSADEIAMIVQRVARGLGMRLPADLSVTGYSNEALSAYTDPALTTIDQSFQEMGRAAALHLIRGAEATGSVGEDGVSPDILIPTRLIVRGSTATAQPR
jgi:LacI family transcriptional regulator